MIIQPLLRVDLIFSIILLPRMIILSDIESRNTRIIIHATEEDEYEESMEPHLSFLLAHSITALATHQSP